MGGWAVVGPTPCGLFIECMNVYVNIILLTTYVCIWLTVCGASEILQGMVGGWMVVGPTCGGSFMKYS